MLGSGKGFEELLGEAFKKVTNGASVAVFENSLDKNGMLYIRRASGKFYDSKDTLISEGEQSRLEFLIGEGILTETNFSEEQVLNSFKYIITDGYDIYKADGKTEFNEEQVWSNRNFAYDEYFFESKEDARRMINLNNWSESGVYADKVMVRVR